VKFSVSIPDLSFKVSYYNILVWLIAITVITGMKFYFLWENEWILQVLFIITFLFFLARLKIQYQVNDLIVLTFLVLLAIYMSLPKSQGEFDIPFGPLFILVLLSLTIDKRAKVFKIFSWIFAISFIPGMVVLMLSGIGLDLGYETLVKESLSNYIIYKKYLGSVFLQGYNPGLLDTQGNIIPYTGGLFNRFCGMFSEPGYVGTIAALLIIADNFNLKKINNIILLIGGLLTLSLAFFILISIYIIGNFGKYLIQFLVKLSIIKKMIFFIFLVLSVAFVMKNEYTKRFILSRLRIEEGWIRGDNRASDEFNVHYKQFLNMGFEKKLFGLGNNAHVNTNTDVSSYKGIIYNYGFLGFSLIIGFLLIYGIYFFRKKSGILFMLLFVLSLYQRASFFAITNLTIFFTGLANLKYQFQEEQRILKETMK